MNKEKIKSILSAFKVQLNSLGFSDKTLLLLGGIILFFLLFIFVVILGNRGRIGRQTTLIPTSPPQKKQVETPTGAPENKILKAGYSLNCQIVIDTSEDKKFLKKIENCGDKFDYRISVSGKYMIYRLDSNPDSGNFFIYSLLNNSEVKLQIDLAVFDYSFDKKDNLSVLKGVVGKFDKQYFNYFYIPMLFSKYPGNVDQSSNAFSDLAENSVELNLPNLGANYQTILVKDNSIDILNEKGEAAYSLSYATLSRELIPTKPAGLVRENLDWSRRIFFYDGEFKTADLNFKNPLTHKFNCAGVDVLPLNYFENLFARSTDGKILAFLIPSSKDIKDNPNWKDEVAQSKKPFNTGVIVLYDLVFDKCQPVNLTQTIEYAENFSFSPKGNFLAFSNNGVSIFDIKSKKTHNLTGGKTKIGLASDKVIGSLIWGGSGRSIFTLISRNDLNASSIKLVRISFDNSFKAKEDVLVDLTSSQKTVYAASPSSDKAIYESSGDLYILDIPSNSTSLFKKYDPTQPVISIIWASNGKIISNYFIGDESSKYSYREFGDNFQVGSRGDIIVLNQADEIIIEDLIEGKRIGALEEDKLKGKLLKLFY